MRLIDADALKETIATNVYPVADAFNSRDYGMFWTGGIEKAIDEQPTIEERKKGKWHSRIYSKIEMFVCSECQHEYSYDAETGERFYNYCPNCGSYNGGEGNETD